MTRATADYAIRARDETSGPLGRIRGNLGLTGKAFGAMAAFATSALASISFTSHIREMIDYGDAVQKASIRTKFGAEGLTQLYHAAKLNDVQIETVNKALFRMQRSTGDAARGLKDQSDAFRDLNIDVNKFQQLRPEDQFRVLVDRLGTMDDKARQAVSGNALFGRSFEELVPLIDGGTQSLDSYVAAANKAANILTDEQAQAAAEANDAWTNLGARIEGQANRSLPLWARMSKSAAAIGETALDGLSAAAERVAGGYGAVTDVIGGVFTGGIAALAGDTRLASDILAESFEDAGNNLRDMLGLQTDSIRAFGEMGKAAGLAMGEVADVTLREGGAPGELGFLDPFASPAFAAASEARIAATERLAQMMSTVEMGLADRAGLDGRSGSVAELGRAQIALDRPGLGLSRPQQVQSPQFEAAVEYLRQILDAVQADRVAVLG